MATTVIDLDRLARAIETRDADTQVAAYADDAVLENVDRDHPPGDPAVLRGRDAIAELVRDVASRDMEHQVTEAFLAGDRGVLRVDCRHPDGSKVACLATFELRDGLIARQRQIQIWDD